MLNSLSETRELQPHLAKRFISSIASKNNQLAGPCRIELADGINQPCTVQELPTTILKLKHFR
jgi:predicted dienelactone hydrolase